MAILLARPIQASPDSRKSPVVMVAHYDHIGTMPVREGEDGVYNGADDNASGTAVVLEVARLLAAGEPPKRSVVALLTSAEEWLGYGAMYFVAHTSADAMAVVINIDQVGREIAECSAYGAPLCEAAQAAGRRVSFQFRPDSYREMKTVYMLDAWPFVKKRIPTLSFFGGLHEDHHRPTDEVDRIQFDNMVQSARAIHAVIDGFAQGGRRPAFEMPEWIAFPDK